MSSGTKRRWPLVAVAVVVLLLLAGGLTLLGRSTREADNSVVAAPAVSATTSPAAASATPTTAPATTAQTTTAPAASPSPSLAPVKQAYTEGVSTDDPHPSLGAVATPSWAKEPPMTTILHSSLRTIPIYNYTQGQAPSTSNGLLITLNNPTLEGLTFTMAGFGETDGFYLALLDVRPNQTYGWVKAADVTVSSTPWRIEISQTHHRLLLWKGDTVMGDFAVAVGKASTPTPDGFFFVNTVIKESNPGGDYGPWIVSSSGFSEVYTTFGAGGGDAAIGLHGSDEPLLIGQSVSHGCIRMYNGDIPLIAATVPVGTLFEIHA